MLFPIKTHRLSFVWYYFFYSLQHFVFSLIHAVIRVAACCCHFVEIFFIAHRRHSTTLLYWRRIYYAIFFHCFASFSRFYYIFVSVIIVFVSCAYLEILFNGVYNWVEHKKWDGIAFFFSRVIFFPFKTCYLSWALVMRTSFLCVYGKWTQSVCVCVCFDGNKITPEE